MRHHDDDQPPEDTFGETTSAFDAELLDERDERDDTRAAVAEASLKGTPHNAALLVVKRGPNVGSRFLLDRPLTTAGRHPNSDIFLDDITVSRRHVEFYLDEEGTCAVTDEGSLNGTYVNRAPVDSAVLANGDEVQIGKFRLLFVKRSSSRDE